MTWIDELRDELSRRQSEQPPKAQIEGGSNDEAASTGTLVRRLLDQMNEELLAGRGSVWEAQARWGARLWELWWGGTRTEGQHIVVMLLRDSRGTAYLKVLRRRLALQDPRLEHRLQRALQAAFLQPSVFTPRVQGSQAIQEPLSPGQSNDRFDRDGSKSC